MKYFVGGLFLVVMAFALFTIFKYFKEVFKKFKKKKEVPAAADPVETEKKETPEPVEIDSDVKKCPHFNHTLCDLVDNNGDCKIGKEACEKDFEN